MKATNHVSETGAGEKSAAVGLWVIRYDVMVSEVCFNPARECEVYATDCTDAVLQFRQMSASAGRARILGVRLAGKGGAA